METIEKHTDRPRDDRSFSMLQANVYVLLLTIPIGAALFVPFWYVWGGLGSLNWSLATAAALFAAGVVVHELLHGFTWMIMGQKPLGAVKLGFQVKSLTPYAHCREPLDVRAYRWGAAVPGVVLGILPAVAGLATGDIGLLVFGFLFTLAAGGDALILWILRDVPEGSLVEDHPTRAGCYVIVPGAAT